MTVMNVVIAAVLVAVVVVFIIALWMWKRENKRRTDSIWAIAESLERVGIIHSREHAGRPVQEPPVEPDVQSKQPQRSPEFITPIEPPLLSESDTGEISFDFYDHIEEFESDENVLNQEIGKSGKKYTAKELEMLIKE